MENNIRTYNVMYKLIKNNTNQNHKKLHDLLYADQYIYVIQENMIPMT